MKQQAAAMRMQGLTSLSRKVYEAIPITEPWALVAIQQEYRRLHGTDPGFAAIERGTRDCVDAGVARNVGSGFLRVRIDDPTPLKTRDVAQTAEGATLSLVVDEKPAEPDIMNRLGAIGARARYLARELNNLAEECDCAALEAAGQLQRKSESDEKLAQLKTLLGNL